MKIHNFDPEYTATLGGVSSGGSATISSTVTTTVVNNIGSGDVTYYLPTLVQSITAAGAAHMHAVGEVVTADGTATTFYLANWADPDSVAAYVNGIRQEVTQSGDAVTFVAAPYLGSRVQFDYIVEMS